MPQNQLVAEVVKITVAVISACGHPVAIIAVFVADFAIAIFHISDRAEMIDATAIVSEVVAADAIAIIAIAAGLVGRVCTHDSRAKQSEKVLPKEQSAPIPP